MEFMDLSKTPYAMDRQLAKMLSRQTILIGSLTSQERQKKFNPMMLAELKLLNPAIDELTATVRVLPRAKKEDA